MSDEKALVLAKEEIKKIQKKAEEVPKPSQSYGGIGFQLGKKIVSCQLFKGTRRPDTRIKSLHINKTESGVEFNPIGRKEYDKKTGDILESGYAKTNGFEAKKDTIIPIPPRKYMQRVAFGDNPEKAIIVEGALSLDYVDELLIQDTYIMGPKSEKGEVDTKEMLFYSLVAEFLDENNLCLAITGTLSKSQIEVPGIIKAYTSPDKAFKGLILKTMEHSQYRIELGDFNLQNMVSKENIAKFTEGFKKNNKVLDTMPETRDKFLEVLEGYLENPLSDDEIIKCLDTELPNKELTPSPEAINELIDDIF